MSLNYGYPDNRDSPRKGWLNYDFTYKDLTVTSDRRPQDLKFGHPQPYAYAYDLNQNSEFTIVTHKFDQDSTINNLNLKYKIWYPKKDGTNATLELFQANMQDYRIGSGNIFVLNKTFRFSNIISDYGEMVGFNIIIQRVGGQPLGNESNINIIVKV